NEAGIKSDKVILFGGGAKSRIWRQIIADIFNTKIVTLNVEEGPSYGGAILAGVGCGVFSSVVNAAKKVIREVDEVKPLNENVTKYRKVYEVYKSLYRNLKDDFASLNKIF
ncbi:MAG: xylulokinase, partial [Actinobacteria bacterium]|nr:xylulokinase [Actinomycetota bacterium]